MFDGISTTTLALTGILLLEQVLANVPAIKSNSTFQLICNITNMVTSVAKGVFGVKVIQPSTDIQVTQNSVPAAEPAAVVFTDNQP